MIKEKEKESRKGSKSKRVKIIRSFPEVVDWVRAGGFETSKAAYTGCPQY